MGLRKVGGAWKKQAKNGKSFLSVSFEPKGRGGPKFSFMIFPNEFDEEHPQGNKPDFSCMMSDGDDDRRNSRPTDDESPF